MNARPEHLLLFHAARGPMGDASLERVRKILDDGLDPENLWIAAERYGTVAGVLDLLHKAGAGERYTDGAPREAAAREIARTVAAESCVEGVFAALDGAGVTFIPLKGADARIARGPRRTVNPMDDVDVLVRPEDAENAAEALERGGFRYLGALSGAHLNFVRTGDFPLFVEVHHDLVNRRSPVQRRVFHPRMESVWERSIGIDGRVHLSLSDAVCHSAAHGVKEYFHRPKWLGDCAFLLGLVGSEDQPSLRAVSAEWGTAAALGFIAAALAELTGDATCAALAECGAKPPGLLGRYVAERLVGYDRLHRLRPLIWVAAADSSLAVGGAAAGFFMERMARMFGRGR